MAPLLDHLRGQVLRRPAVRVAVLVVHVVIGPSEICKFDAAVICDQDVLRLDVPVNNVVLLGVQALDSAYDLPNVLAGLLLFDLAFFPQQLIQLAARTELEHQVDVRVVLVVVVYLEYVGMVQLVLDLDLQADLMHEIFVKYFLLRDDLDSIYIFSLFVADLVNLAESPDAHVLAEQRLEVVTMLLPVVSVDDRGRQVEDAILHGVDSAGEVLRHDHRWHVLRLCIFSHF